jgi:hypothetical protein
VAVLTLAASATSRKVIFFRPISGAFSHITAAKQSLGPEIFLAAQLRLKD